MESTPLSRLGILQRGAAAHNSKPGAGASSNSRYTSFALEAYQSAKIRYHVKPVMSGRRTWFNRFVDVPSGHEPSAVQSSAPEEATSVTMDHARLEEILPYASDPHFLEDCVDIRGNLRVDLLLEDLDSFAAAVGYRHCDLDPGSDYPPSVTIVTASVSALRYQTKPKALQDALLMGFVSFVGRTSFEVTIRLRSLEGDEVFLEGQFQMVALGKETGRPVAVNRLELRTDEERRIFEQGEKRSALAKESRQKSLLASESPPTPEETTLIHQLYLEARQYDGPKASDPALEHFSSLAVPSDIRFISDTWLDNTTLTQPQDRNVHFKVFGGHLMRLGYGLAWAVGSLFSRDTNNFLHFDEVVFRKPVEIGSMLVLGGQVTYVSPTRRSFLVTVSADILNPKTGERANSNHFHVIFTTRGTLQSDGTHLPIPRLLPKSYGESMSFIDGKRRWEAARRQAEVEGAEELDRW